MSERKRMTEERLAEIRRFADFQQPAMFVSGKDTVRLDLLDEIDALRAERDEARLGQAVADGTATPEMLRDAGLLEDWFWDDAECVWQYHGFDDAALWNRGWRVLYRDGEESSTLANLRAADAAVRKLLAEGEATD